MMLQKFARQLLFTPLLRIGMVDGTSLSTETKCVGEVRYKVKMRHAETREADLINAFFNSSFR